jgi:hypothetical protein
MHLIHALHRDEVAQQLVAGQQHCAWYPAASVSLKLARVHGWLYTRLLDGQHGVQPLARQRLEARLDGLENGCSCARTDVHGVMDGRCGPVSARRRSRVPRCVCATLSRM